jgi:hypothetical protein
MRLRLVGIGVTLAALAASQAGAAAPERDQVIRMGKGIGKIQLGMTMRQVRRALGGPHRVVYRRHNFGARGRYIELGWELPGRTSWDVDAWQIGFRSTSRRGPLRVVRVATSARSQRTPKRIGIGSTVQQIVRAYPDATCITRWPPSELPHPYNWIEVRQPTGGMTVFNLESSMGRGDDPSRLARVTAVMVQRDWFSKGPGHEPCRRGWEGW